jgi:protein phosphatase 2C family protein 2/3
MSFIKNKNLSIDVPDEHERIPPAPISNTNRSLKNRHLELTKTSDSKSLTTKNTQRVTFDFDDPSSYPLQPAGRIIIPNHESTKWSVKDNGIVKAYAANTNQGIVRDYNEDRVSIILNILKPQSRENEDWPRCSFFGVYDGHGGAGCADFLRDSLHQYVIREPSFPWNPKEAIKEGFMKAEKKFMDNNYILDQGVIDKSGSCAIVVLIVGDLWFVANVGDSRAVLSGDGGKKIFPLSLDHKPCDDTERKRIMEAGGQIYQTVIPKNLEIEQEFGPHRVLPGRLSVSRTFGDLEAKIKKLEVTPVSL